MSGGEKMPTGILYETAPRETFAHRFREEVTREPLTTLEPPAAEKIEELLSEFRASGD